LKVLLQSIPRRGAYKLHIQDSIYRKISTKAISGPFDEEKGRFPKTFTKGVFTLFRIKGTLAGKDIIISIAPTRDKNYASTKCANQLVILESNIIKTINSMVEKQHDINNLQLSIGDYTCVSQFTIKYLFCDDSDTILGSS